MRRQLLAIFACLLSIPGSLSARLRGPEGREDIRQLAEHAAFIFHARIISIESVWDTVAGVGREVQIANLAVDRWYVDNLAPGQPRPATVRLKYFYPGFAMGHDCIDLNRSFSWLIFARLEGDGLYRFSDDCEGGLPMSAALAPGSSSDWVEQLQQDLIAGLQDADPAVRLANIARLGGLKLQSSSEALHELIEHGSEDESRWATYAALRSGDLSAFPAVERIVVNIIPFQAEHKPSELPPFDSSPLNAAPSSDPETLIVLEIERLRDPEAVPALVRILKSAKSSWVRESALLALGDINDPRCLAELIDQLSDSSFLVRYRALAAINRITDASECLPTTSSAGPDFQAAVETCKQWWQLTGSLRDWPSSDLQ